VLAGMVALINSARIAAGKSPLGFLNPALYLIYRNNSSSSSSPSSSFRDITEGNNNCIAMATVCCGQGFSAGAGWDPVTGLGSPHFPALQEALLALGDSPNIPTQQPVHVPNQPTAATTRAPSPSSAAPTIAPTDYPTVGTGYVHPLLLHVIAVFAVFRNTFKTFILLLICTT
jgi:hypothetical protein